MDRSMIPLGSCTMKLNATSEMIPSPGPSLATSPAPPSQPARLQSRCWTSSCAIGCASHRLRRVSLQPNARAPGEYAGLLAIKGYHEAARRSPPQHLPHPQQRHGTNPASARWWACRWW